MNRALTKIFTDILSLPTAPYCEDVVSTYVQNFAKRRDLPVTIDRYGNLIVRYTNGNRPKPVALTTHMDHPGFVVRSAEGRDLTGEWLGGCDPRHFPGSRVTIISNGQQISGRVTSPLSHTERNNKPRLFSIKSQKPLASEEGAYGYWGLKPVEFKDDLIHTKAADNLANCATILAVLDHLRKQKAPADLWGVFTRAEETGLVGASGMVEAKTIPKRVPLIVLEASRALPGAEIGSGPVIRVGDRLSIFDPQVEYAVHALAQNLASRRKTFQFQRQLMAGGTCEASLYVLHGYTVGALALPLGNYHNQSKRWPAEEFISASDAENMVHLCTAIAQHPPSGETRGPMKQWLAGRFKGQKKRLLESNRF